jgi:hypothetical protein
MHRIDKVKKILIICCLLAGLTGCGPRLIYPHLEWLVPWYVSDYVSLDKSQKNMLQNRLLKQLDWHCRTQLPMYAEVLRAIGQDFADPNHPINYQKIQAYNTKLMKLWGELMQQIGPDIVDIMATATDEQIDELFENLAKQNQEFQEKYIDPPPSKLIEKRQQRMIKRIKYWISDLTAEQKAVVADWSTQLKPIAEDWLQNREHVQLEARRLMAQRNEPGFRGVTLDLIVNSESMQTTAYQNKIDANIDTSIKFVIQLNQTLSRRQRSYLLNRIESLATDFDKLSCDPKK